jgi:hypothetical protein
VPAPPPVVPISPLLVPTPTPLLQAEIAAPHPGDRVTRSFTLEVAATNADRIDVFLDPDRNEGGRLVSSAATLRVGNSLRVTVNAPLGQQTLHVHVFSTGLGQEQILTVPVVVRP